MKKKLILLLTSMMTLALSSSIHASTHSTRHHAATSTKKKTVAQHKTAARYSKKGRKTHQSRSHSSSRKHLQSANAPFAEKFTQDNTVDDMLLAKNSTRSNVTLTKNIDERKILKNAPALDPQALNYAVRGYNWALRKGNVNNPNVLTIIDFNKPSSAKRLWVIDLRNSQVLLNLYTTHGKNSGATVAQRFSEKVGSDMTSLGVYETLNRYSGGHGLSLKLQGLERGVNDTAYRRTVVVHPAWYATPSYVQKNNGAGRSWGCFAVDPNISAKLINTIENGSIIFAYANQEKQDPVLA
jgi:hypothetical protein